MQSYNPNQYYNDYMPAVQQSSINWSAIIDVVMGISIMCILVLFAGIL